MISARKGLIFLAVLVTVVASVTASLLMPRVYRSEVSILVIDKDAGATLAGAVLSELSSQPERSMMTQVKLIQQRPIAEKVIRKLNLRTTRRELMQRVEVTAEGQTNLITLAVTDSNPKRAAATANAFATTYVEWSRDTKRESITNALTEIGTRLAEAEVEILDLGRRMNGGNSSELQSQLDETISKQKTLTERLTQLSAEQQAEKDAVALSSIASELEDTERQLEDSRAKIVDLGSRLASAGDADNNKELLAKLQIATGLYTTLAEKQETLKVSEQLELGSGRVVASAVIEPDPISPKPLRNGLTGLVVGLMFGLMAAFLAEYLDNTIKSADEVRALFDAPVLGNIPAEQMAADATRQLTIVQRPGSHAAEAYRSLRNGIEYVNFAHDIKTLLVTSAAPGEGKSTVSANLAASLAMAGAKVVLVDCDFRRSTIDQFFDVNNQLGLSDVLMERASLRASLQRTGDDRLTVLTSGKMPPNPSELLGSEQMIALIETLKEDHDWIIVDSPPLLAVADAAATARWSDGVLVVTRAGTSTHPAAINAREVLEKVGARILGVVVWGLDVSRSRPEGGTRGYYRGYYSEYYGGEQVDSGARGTHEIAPARGAGESATHPQSQGRLTGRWASGWRLSLLILVIVAVVLVAIVLVLDARYGLLGL